MIRHSGASGSNPDSGIFLESPIKDFVENHDADFPEPVHLDTIGNVRDSVVMKPAKMHIYTPFVIGSHSYTGRSGIQNVFKIYQTVLTERCGRKPKERLL